MSATSGTLEEDMLREQLLAQRPELKSLLDRLSARLGRAGDRGVFAPIRNSHCSACGMTVASARLQRAKRGELINCACCSRFIYIEQIERSSMFVSSHPK
jgi:predicted  nucleic acid-binding Zn-ribbon protein